MKRSVCLSDQHKEILRMVRELSGRLGHERPKADPDALSHLLARLSARVSIHLEMEEGSEGPGAEWIGSFNHRWTAVAIEGDQLRFAQEMRAVLYSLERRIEREETGLDAGGFKPAA